MLLFLLLSVCLTITTAEITFTSPDILNGSYTIVNVHLHLEDLWKNEISIRGIVEEGIEGGREYYNISNFIFFNVVDTIYLFKEQWRDVLALQELGAKYVVIREKIEPPGRRYIFDRYREGIEIPVVAIEAKRGKELIVLLNESVGLEVILTAVPDVNSWTAFKPVVLSFNVVLVVLSAVPLGIAIYRLVQFAQMGQCGMSISIICLSLNLIGDILRIAGVIIDPYNLISLDMYVLGIILSITPFFFLISSGLLMAFYWAEIIKSNTSKLSVFLVSFRIPFYVVIAILFITNLVFTFCLIFTNIDLQILLFIVDFLVILFTGIFYISTGSGIYKTMTSINKESKVTKLIIAAGTSILFVTIILCISLIISITIEWKYRMLDLSTYTLLWISFFITSSLLSYIFRPNLRKTHTTKSFKSKATH